MMLRRLLRSIPSHRYRRGFSLVEVVVVIAVLGVVLTIIVGVMQMTFFYWRKTNVHVAAEENCRTAMAAMCNDFHQSLTNPNGASVSGSGIGDGNQGEGPIVVPTSTTTGSNEAVSGGNPPAAPSGSADAVQAIAAPSGTTSGSPVKFFVPHFASTGTQFGLNWVPGATSGYDLIEWQVITTPDTNATNGLAKDYNLVRANLTTNLAASIVTTSSGTIGFDVFATGAFNRLSITIATTELPKQNNYNSAIQQQNTNGANTALGGATYELQSFQSSFEQE